MKSLIHKLLKFTWTIREYKDKEEKLQWHFNMLNPIGWVLLLTCAAVVGTFEGLHVMYRMVKDTVQDSLNS